MSKRLVFAVMIAGLATPALAAPTVEAMQGSRRVLIVSAPGRDDSRLKAQQETIGSWRSDAQDRDVTTVEIVGDTVDGAADGAGALRQRYHLPALGFSVVLIGKDGHVAMRSTTPVGSVSLVQRSTPCRCVAPASDRLEVSAPSTASDGTPAAKPNATGAAIGTEGRATTSFDATGLARR